MKKLIILSVLAIVVVGSIFTQEKTADARANWISGEVSFLGGGVRYERMLGSSLSVGANAYYSGFFLGNDWGLDASVRFYPWGTTFFAGVALGYHGHEVFDGKYGSRYDYTTFGVGITPEIGWKIDLGNAGGFFIQPGIRVPITIGETQAFPVQSNSNSVSRTDFGVVFNLVPYIGAGYAF